MNKEIRVVFMGTPDFSVPVLEMLIENYQVVGIVSQPDKPIGRSGKMSTSPVKEVALKCNIPLYQPAKVRKEYEEILNRVFAMFKEKFKDEFNFIDDEEE